MTVGPDRLTRTRWLFGVGPMLNRDQDAGGATDDNDGDPPGEAGASDDDTDVDGEDDTSSSKDDGFVPITTRAQLDEALTRAVNKRLNRERNKIRREVEQDVANEARQKEAEEQGDYKTLYEEQGAELQKLKDENAARELSDRKRAIAKDEGLPEDMADRLTGDDDDALREDAKKLAGMFKSPDAPDTDSGRTVPNGGGRNKRPGGNEIDYDDPATWLSGL